MSPFLRTARPGASVFIAALILLAASLPAWGQTCELTFEGFGSFGGPADFDNGTYRVEWCENGAQITSSAFCLTGNVLRMTSSAHDPIVWLYVGDTGCTSATLRFDFGSFATTGTALKYATSTDSTLNCSAAINEYAGSIDLADGVCHTAEHTVTLGANDRSIYWKFDHGLPSANAFFIDNVSVLLEGCDCAGGPATHDCCETGAAGCDDATVEACVCAQDSFCCSTEWDAQCVAEVDSFGCGDCGGGSSCSSEFAADFGNFFQSGSVCSLWPDLFETCAGAGPYITSGTGCGGSGDYAMSFGSGFPYSTATTTCLDLSGTAEAALLFSYAKSSGLGPRIEISIDGGGAFSTLWTAPSSPPGDCSNECLDLTAYAGQPDVQLRFSSGTSLANGASFDDIQLVLGSGCASCTPPVADAGADRTMCPGGQTTLAGSANGGTGGICPGAYSVSWQGPGIVSGGSTFTPTVDAPGQYFLTVECEACLAVDSVIVSIDDSAPSVDAGSTVSLPCQGSELQLAGGVAGCAGSLNVNWSASSGGHIVSGGSTLTPTVDAAGVYTLLASCNGGCPASDSVQVIDRIPGDIDGDGDVDLLDFAALADCLHGPAGTASGPCLCADIEADTDVDLRDFAGLQGSFGAATAFTGACCATNGLCSATTATSCRAAGGTYHGDGDTCANVICPFGSYQNEIDPITDFFGIGSTLADDLTLDGIGARELVYYDIAVYGGSNGGGPFDVTTVLYTDCPGQGGVEIPGTASTITAVPDDGFVYILTTDLSAAPVTIPDTVWLLVDFSTDQAGWILAGPAETGFTADLFGIDDAPWYCATSFVGEAAPYSGFWANLRCQTPTTLLRSVGVDATPPMSSPVRPSNRPVRMVRMPQDGE